VIGGGSLIVDLIGEEIPDLGANFYLTFDQPDLQQVAVQVATTKHETPIQRFRRKRKERTEANKTELARIVEAKEKKVRELRELKGGLAVMSEISGAGESQVLLVQQYLERADSLDRCRWCLKRLKTQSIFLESFSGEGWISRD